MLLEVYKNLGQVAPAAGVLTPAYAVPLGKQAVVSTIILCNTSSSTSDSFRISHSIGNDTDNIKQYLYRDMSISALNTFAATIGMTLAQGDVIRVYSANGTCSFNVYGTEISDVSGI